MMNNAEKLIEKYQMFKEGDSVLVGLSGGADSVTLLCFLKDIDLSLNLYACHINHGIRGEEADRDEAFCKELCEKMNIPFYCERISVPEISKERKCSYETAGRDERYRILNSLAEKLNAKIAVAHNRDDLSETVIFNIIRGSSADGASSLKPVRGNIYRPLLSVSRSEIEDYLKNKGIDYVEDSTNKDETYTRNKIRHSVLVEMKKINPQAHKHIALFSEALGDDNEFINSEADKTYKELREKDGLSDRLLKSPKAIINRVIAKYLSDCATEVSYDNINALKKLMESGGKVNLSGNSIYLKRGNIILKEEASPYCEKRELRQGENDFEKAKITLSFVDLKDEKEYNKGCGNSSACLKLDADKISGRLYVRSRAYGDKFHPMARGGKTLKKFFNEEKIPPEKRNAVPVVEDENGIVAVLPYSIDGRVSPNSETKRLIIIAYEG